MTLREKIAILEQTLRDYYKIIELKDGALIDAVKEIAKTKRINAILMTELKEQSSIIEAITEADKDYWGEINRDKTELEDTIRKLEKL